MAPFPVFISLVQQRAATTGVPGAQAACCQAQIQAPPRTRVQSLCEQCLLHSPDLNTDGPSHAFVQTWVGSQACVFVCARVH